MAKPSPAKSFRLVIVLDSAPDELVQVVGYLELVADKIDIDLVTVIAYDVNGSRVLVPLPALVGTSHNSKISAI
jgi:hypothetical protein